MSSRMMKRVQLMQHTGSEKDLLPGASVLAGNDASDDEDEQPGSTSNRKNHLNPFDLLNQFSHSESEVKEDDNETEHASAATNLPSTAVAAKKKKRKRKKKTKYSNNHISSEDNDLTDKHVNDIDSIVAKTNNAQSSKQVTPPRIQITKSLFQVELKHLNSHNELRRTFGKRVVKPENRRGRMKHSFKTTYIVSAKDSWPQITRNLITMKSIAAPVNVAGNDHANWFTFEHSPAYQKVQTQFLNAVERNNSESMIELVKRCPYHVDSLIQLSELCKMTEDHSMATELIERAVFAMETALHPSFSLTSGNCRLDYRRQENRSFFVVLFKQAQYLEMRACCRTAFEISKLILNLCPDEDPLAMILVIDYYALRSKQYDWLIRFYEEYDKVRNLSQLPNMAYSYAFALFCTGADAEKQNEALQYALLMFPGVLLPLMEELNVQTDPRVRKYSLFTTDVSSTQSPSLHQLVSLYVCRAKNVWRENNLLPWLEQNVNVVLDRFDRKDIVFKEFNQKRAARYVAPPRAILRHVILADFKEKVPLAPFVVKEKDSILTYDPLPPLDSINFYQRTSSSSSPTTSTNHSLSMFFQSLLPSFNVNAAGEGNFMANALRAVRQDVPAANPQRDAEAELDAVQQQLQEINLNAAPAEGAALNNDALHNSVTQMITSMRDWLQNIGLSESTQAEADIGNYTTDEDSSDYND